MQVDNKALLRKISKIVALVFASVVMVALLFFLSVFAGFFGTLPGRAELADISNEEASLVFSSDSLLIGKYFAQNRTNIRQEEVPDHLKNALIATEDKRFFSHRGYDLRSYFRVFFKSVLFGSNKGGGSTLTQQLIKNLYGRDDFGFMSLPVNKVKEIILAARIEQIYTKDELVLLYLNSVPFGEDVYGVETAARRYFNKHARDLKIEESAVLIGSLKASTHFNPRLNPGNALERRNLVVSLMQKQHYLSAGAADSLCQLPLGLQYENMAIDAPAGYFVYQVKKKTLELLDALKARTGKAYNLEKDGLKIYTTLNMQVQEMATEAVKNHLGKMQPILDRELKSRSFKKQWYNKQRKDSGTYDQDILKREMEVFNWEGVQTKDMSRLDSLWHYYSMLNAAVLITNPGNGAVISWIGGNYFRMLPFDMVLSHRQIASAFKPVVYATALENGIGPCAYLANEVNTYAGYEDWEPRNADRSSTPDSAVAAWYALAHSMNLPTVDLYFRVGRQNLVNTCKKLDFPRIEDDAPSIALGTLDLSLYEIVRAYGAFANQGRMNELVMIDKITDSEGNSVYIRESPVPATVFSPETSQQITAILQEVINQGTGTRIRTQYGVRADLAGKTGSAQNYSDAWFIAYTPDLVVGTWVGARTPDVHFGSSNGSGSALALPVVGAVLREIEQDAVLRNRYFTPFRLPAGVYSFLDCDPFLQKGIKGFFNRLFGTKPDSKSADGESQPKEKRKKGGKSFFERLFKGNR